MTGEFYDGRETPPWDDYLDECYEPKETDYECLKRIFTKAKLITSFDEYNGMFDNEIIVFLDDNELHLNFDKNTQEILPNNDANCNICKYPNECENCARAIENWPHPEKSKV